jgi:uncharacterized protein (TIGR03663 family)
MNRWAGLGLLLICLGALALRGPQLALRPMHNDEAVNAIKIRDLWTHGRYRYDPNEHHGPTLYYATLPFVWLSGAPDFNHLSEADLRAVSVFFGIALIPLLFLLTHDLGQKAVLGAAALTALSPAMVFYSRYFIHEMLLIWFTLLLLVAAWRYIRKPSAAWAAASGVAVGLMYATKETFVIPLGALALAALCSRWWNRRHKTDLPSTPADWRAQHFALAFGIALVVSITLFTSFYTNASGPLDSLRTYVPWLKRAGGDSPHIHPWSFYFRRLFFFKEPRGPLWTEGLILLLAAVGAGWALTRCDRDSTGASLTRFLTFYTVLLAAGYSLISYKTPWCLLGFLQPLIVLAGVGAAVLLQAPKTRAKQAIVGLLLLLGTMHLTWEAWRASYPMAADRRNPYVYAQTSPDLLNLVQKVAELGRVHPAGPRMLIKVIAPDNDYWPLPWYLRQFDQVGWWSKLPADPYAPVMIVSEQLHAALDDRSDKKWLMVQLFELRPKTFLELYVQYELWEKYVAQLPKPTE